MRALLLASALVVLPVVAHAGLLAQYSTDGGATFTPICSDVSGGSCSSTFTSSNGLDFLAFGATSNSPGTTTSANLFSATLRLQNNSGATQSLILSIGDTDFANPTAPPTATLLNNVAGTVIVGGAANALTSIACIDQGNGQNVCPGDYTTPAINAAITLPGAGSNTTTTPVATLTGPYSLTELITLTLSNGALLNYTSSSDVIAAAVPEPAALGILGLGLLGLAAVRRRTQ
jgi:hypothetical protein